MADVVRTVAGVCSQDARGRTHLLYYPDANDNTGDLTVYSYTAEDRWAAVRVDTPNIPTDAGGINVERFTRDFAALATQDIPASLSVCDTQWRNYGLKSRGGG